MIAVDTNVLVGAIQTFDPPLRPGGLARSSSSSPLTIRVVPSLISGTWNLISDPREERPDGFDLNDDLVFDDQIRPEGGVDTNLFIDHRNRLLAHCAESPPTQFYAKTVS
jgi:hypothetical protein